MPEPVPTSSTRVSGRHEFLQSFQAQARGFVYARAEGHPRIHHDAETARGRGVVAPFRREEKALAHGHGLQQIAGRFTQSRSSSTRYAAPGDE